MVKKLVIAGCLVAGAVGLLLYSAINSTAKAVMTVSALSTESQDRPHIRLGARVAEGEIQYQTTPEFRLSFMVHDIKNPGPTVRVTYNGIMPDTLKVGRDVILEGDFRQGEFFATSLLTQCPSKYEVPGGPGAEVKR